MGRYQAVAAALAVRNARAAAGWREGTGCRGLHLAKLRRTTATEDGAYLNGMAYASVETWPRAEEATNPARQRTGWLTS
jgi:hypothetical protein